MNFKFQILFSLSIKSGFFQATEELPRVAGGDAAELGEEPVRIKRSVVPFCYSGCVRGLMFMMLSLLKALSLLRLLWLPAKRKVELSTTGTHRCTTVSCLCAVGTSVAPCIRAGSAQVSSRGVGPGGHRVGPGGLALGGPRLLLILFRGSPSFCIPHCKLGPRMAVMMHKLVEQTGRLRNGVARVGAGLDHVP